MTALALTSPSPHLGLSPRRPGRAPLLVQDGLVAEWRFTDGAGQQLTDASGNGHHGRLGSTSGADSDDPTWTPQGLSFDGDDFVEHGTVGDFGATPRSLLAVVRTGAEFGVEWLGDGSLFTRWTLRSKNGVVRLEVAGAGHSSTFTVPIDAWFFVAATQSTDNLDSAIIYLDGEFEAVTTSSDPLDTRGNFSWARQNNSSVAMEAAYGLVYDRALSAEEVEHNRQVLKEILAGRGIALP